MTRLPITRRDALAGLAATALTAATPGRAVATASRPWLATPAQVRAETMLLSLLADPAIVELQGRIRTKLASGERARTIPDAARTLDGAIGQWINSLIFAELLKDARHPAFLWATDDTPRDWIGHHLGGVGTSGDNPDNIYRTAGIAGGGRYEIVGRYHPDSRPTQVLIEVHATDLARPSTMMTPTAGGKAPDPRSEAQINQDAFRVDEQGRFRILLGDPAGGPDHLPIPASGYAIIGVRDVLADWRQRACALTLNRLDAKTAAPFGLGEARTLILADLENYVDFWSHFPSIWFGGLKPNAHSAPQQRPGGWGYVAGVNFHLAPDEAMIVTTSPAGAAYTGFQLNDPWMIAPDARYRQVSLNKSQVASNPDGTVTYVIAARDPGAANWLDTNGDVDGFGIIRWQALSPVADKSVLIRDVRVLPLADVTRVPDLPRVTPAERRAQIAARKAAYETRVS